MTIFLKLQFAVKSIKLVAKSLVSYELSMNLFLTNVPLM